MTQAASMDELAGHCFACGPNNPQGLHLAFTIDRDALSATADFELTEMHQGPPGLVHGGIIATLLDEAASKVNRALGVLAMTRQLEIDYLRPAPIRTLLRVTGRHLRRDGRKLFHESVLTIPDGAVLARANLLFIVIPDAHLPPHIRGRITAADQDFA